MADQSSNPTSGGEEAAIIKRILKEEKFKLEEVFVEMLRVMGERHVLCERRKREMVKAITPKQVAGARARTAQPDPRDLCAACRGATRSLKHSRRQ